MLEPIQLYEIQWNTDSTSNDRANLRILQILLAVTVPFGFN